MAWSPASCCQSCLSFTSTWDLLGLEFTCWAGRNHKQTTYQVPIRSAPVVTWLSLHARTSAFLVGTVPFISQFLEVSIKEQGLVLNNWTGMSPLCLCKLPQVNSQADESESLTEWNPSTRVWWRIFRVYKNRRIYCLSTHRSQHNPAFCSQLCLGVTETYSLVVFIMYTDCSGYFGHHYANGCTMG